MSVRTNGHHQLLPTRARITQGPLAGAIATILFTYSDGSATLMLDEVEDGINPIVDVPAGWWARITE